MPKLTNFTTEDDKDAKEKLSDLIHEDNKYRQPFTNLKMTGDALDNIPNSKIVGPDGEPTKNQKVKNPNEPSNNKSNS